MRNRDILTKNQQRVYQLLKGYIAKHGEAPTISEMADKLGVTSLRTVTQYLESLQRKGLIRRDRYVQRGIRLIEDQMPNDEFIMVPVFASAGCGSPSVIAERTFDEFIPISTSLANGKKENLFVIKAIGSSMVDAGIKDGDFVLVEMTEDVKTDDLVVAIIDDTAVIKQIRFANNAIILNPVTTSPEYQPIILKKDFQIFGKVIQTIKVEKEDYQIVPIHE